MKYVTDIEINPNAFLAGFRKVGEKDKIWFEISPWKDQKQELVQFLSEVKYLVGFNSVNFDSVILCYIVKNVDKVTAFDIWEMGQYIIYHDSEEAKEVFEEERQYSLWKKETKYNLSLYKGDNFDRFKYYRYPKWKNIDLFLFWSKLIRQSRKLSLKSLAVNMGWHWIQELPYGPTHEPDENEWQEIKDYCGNDIDITYELMTRLKDPLEFRFKLHQKEGFNCLSWDDVKIGTEFLLSEMSKETKIPLDELKSSKTFRKSFTPREFLPKVEFETEACKKYYDMLITQTFTPNDERFSQSIRFKNPDGSVIISDLGVGGIHGMGTHKIIIPKENEILSDEDVVSLYPTLAAEWEFTPKHMPKVTGKFIKDKIAERKTYSKGTFENSLIKLGLNGFVGNYRNSYSPLCDAQPNLAICLTGQLLILKATEMCIKEGINVVMQNTDGFTCLYDKSKRDAHKRIVEELSVMFRVDFEETLFAKMWAMNINNYLALQTNGKPKEKGDYFLTNPSLDMSHDFLIISKAIQAFLIKGISPEEFINGHDNILDFTMAPKIAKLYDVYWYGHKVQNLNRFYPSLKGAYLYKKKKGTKRNMEHVFADRPVKLLNWYDKSLPLSSYDVDKSYFIHEVNKILINMGVIKVQEGLI